MNEDAAQGLDEAPAATADTTGQSDPTQSPRHPASAAGQNRVDKPPGRGKRGGSRGKSAYTFADGLEHCFCRNAIRVPPETFPVAGRSGAATPKMVELARSDKVILLCDLLHEGPHMWPDGEEFTGR